MSISKPAATFAREGSTPSPTGPLDMTQAGVRRCSVELSVDESHDRVELVIWNRSVLADTAPDASLTVGLGFGDDLSDVLTVDVHSVEIGSRWTILTGFAPSRRMSSTFLGRSYNSQTLADVVVDLLGEADVEGGKIEAALMLPAFHVDPRRSVWGHLHALGRRFGHQVTSTASGAVSFSPAPGASGGGLGGGLTNLETSLPARLPFGSDDLREGAELMSFAAGPRSTTRSTASVSPSAPSAWYLLAAEPDSGSGTPVEVDPVLRSREAADVATQAGEAAASRRSQRMRARVPGRSSLRAGAVISARGEPHRVLFVRHLLDARDGYVCDLVMEGGR